MPSKGRNLIQMRRDLLDQHKISEYFAETKRDTANMWGSNFKSQKDKKNI